VTDYKIDKISNGIKKCKTCGNEYEEMYTIMLGHKIVYGDGNCDNCNNKLKEKESALEKLRRQREIDIARQEHKDKIGIPFRYKNTTFKSFQLGFQDKALKVCFDYANEFPKDKRPRGYKSLYLWSTASWGTGKTHLAVSICHELLDRWNGEGYCFQPLFMSEPELFRRIQATYSYDYNEQRNKESESDIINQIANADLVVLDDVGKEPRTDMKFVRRTLFAIINARYDNDLPLIITANLDPVGLKAHLDEPPTEASFNRFFEMTGGISTQMDGNSFRKRTNGNS
jgi:DNA replication protein DnaC